MNPRPQINNLLADLCDGSLSDNDWGRLDNILATDVSARRAYIEYLSLHADLVLGLEPANPSASEQQFELSHPHKPQTPRLCPVGAATTQPSASTSQRQRRSKSAGLSFSKGRMWVVPVTCGLLLILMNPLCLCDTNDPEFNTT